MKNLIVLSKTDEQGVHRAHSFLFVKGTKGCVYNHEVNGVSVYQSIVTEGVAHHMMSISISKGFKPGLEKEATYGTQSN